MLLTVAMSWRTLPSKYLTIVRVPFQTMGAGLLAGPPSSTAPFRSTHFCSIHHLPDLAAALYEHALQRADRRSFVALFL